MDNVSFGAKVYSSYGDGFLKRLKKLAEEQGNSREQPAQKLMNDILWLHLGDNSPHAVELVDGQYIPVQPGTPRIDQSNHFIVKITHGYDFVNKQSNDPNLRTVTKDIDASDVNFSLLSFFNDQLAKWGRK